MKKWLIAAVAFLLLTTVSYYGYKSLTEKKNLEQPTAHHGEKTAEDQNQDGHEHEGGHAKHETSKTAESEVTTEVAVQNSELVISVKDASGRPVEKLDINHEKLMHLIVVDNHLNNYVHFHPQQKEPGVFTVSHSLEAGSYKAFVDIKPNQLTYTVEPILFSIGKKETEHNHSTLKADESFVKTVDGRSVELKPSSQKANQAVELLFSVEGQLEPHLGAVGHVVILDEKAEQFVHVHPVSETKPLFETQFKKPGMYKIWAEFKQEGKVRVYPFTLEITE